MLGVCLEIFLKVVTEYTMGRDCKGIRDAGKI